MSYKETYNWDPEEGSAVVKLETNSFVFMGSARCHPDDKDVMSEHIGTDIAATRARINVLRHIRDDEIKPGLKALEHVFTNMKTSKKFNPKSYEARMIRRQVNIYKENLKAIKALIKDYNTYIQELAASASNYKKIKAKIKMDKNE